jgi:hypothetical protein
MHWLVCLLDDFGGGLRHAYTLGEGLSIVACTALCRYAYECFPMGLLNVRPMRLNRSLAYVLTIFGPNSAVRTFMAAGRNEMV